jgi:hypothetical protein
MVVMLSWVMVGGQDPSLALLPDDLGDALAIILETIAAGRHVQLYDVDCDAHQLTLVYPTATTAVVTGQLVKK